MKKNKKINKYNYFSLSFSFFHCENNNYKEEFVITTTNYKQQTKK